MLETFERPSQPLVSQRQAAFGRLVASVVSTLNFAIEARKSEGQTSKEIAEKIGCHKSALSRVLNGTTRNITLKTISDILWATDFEPIPFSAERLEDICPNSPTFESARDINDISSGNFVNMYRVRTNLDPDIQTVKPSITIFKISEMVSHGE
ncbi:helix-turn-helix domain-containing protein [Novosphingobium sp.]|uniref:helix-turn-helix domain-containing protein n=1 Tax=Novosphingobium sp. TaxID=1874826 RepID=UPI0035AE563A